MLDYTVIASGSSGNSVLIGDVLVDCGVPYNRLKEHLYSVKHLLLTHIHSDHINRQTLESIKKKHPKISIWGNHEVYQKHGVDVVVGDYPVRHRGFEVEPFSLVHDVVTTGYVWKDKGHRILYATDTSSLEKAPEGKYDYLFLESNYDEVKVKMAMESHSGNGYCHAFDNLRHLSSQQAKTFYYTRRASKEAVWVELHKSAKFY